MNASRSRGLPSGDRACPLHGPGLPAAALVGRRLESVVTSWHRSETAAPSGPLDVWLIDATGASVHLTTGSEWCLIVAEGRPHTGYDLGPDGRLAVVPLADGTPFAAHLGQRVTAVGEEYEEHTGRVAVEIAFATGRVRCDSRAGELRVT
ncbi:hypothetical protein ACFYXS_33200 [Streptomyces sp. NPDC002574]|uniref:hypothetical protein n=1 Tax=Streptomyces sp. NPDC002574 TaxID=3364652 RepID=UPI003688F5E8